MLLPLFGAFRDRVKADYPGVHHAVPIVDVNAEMPLDAHTGAPLPRVWFTSADGGLLLQLQQDRVYSNWRQFAGGQEYPRFPEISDRFFVSFNALNDVLLQETGIGLTVVRHEVTYVNVIPLTKDGTSVKFEDVFSVAQMPVSALLGAPAGLNLSLHFKPDGFEGKVSVRIDSAKNMRTGEDCFRFELTAASDAGIETDGRSWTGSANILLNNAFLELTRPEFRKGTWGGNL